MKEIKLNRYKYNDALIDKMLQDELPIKVIAAKCNINQSTIYGHIVTYWDKKIIYSRKKK